MINAFFFHFTTSLSNGLLEKSDCGDAFVWTKFIITNYYMLLLLYVNKLCVLLALFRATNSAN